MGTQSPKLAIVPSVEEEEGGGEEEEGGERKKKHQNAATTFPAVMTPLLLHMMSLPTVFSFHKLADPRIAGPFTRMTSSAQTVPTVLNKAQACFSVGVPLLHWDSYERREWEDLCTKLVTENKQTKKKKNGELVTNVHRVIVKKLNHYNNILSFLQPREVSCCLVMPFYCQFAVGSTKRNIKGYFRELRRYWEVIWECPPVKPFLFLRRYHACSTA